MPKYRKMTDDEMKNAIDLVLSGESAYKASKKHGIPSNTLKVSHETHERGYTCTYMSVWVVPLYRMAGAFYIVKNSGDIT